jgi:hypothetical protein
MNRFVMVNENIGDRMIRIWVGAWLFVLALAGPTWWWGLLGLFPLITGWTGRCPLYALLGRSTLKGESRPAQTSPTAPIEAVRVKSVQTIGTQEPAKPQTGRAA